MSATSGFLKRIAWRAYLLAIAVWLVAWPAVTCTSVMRDERAASRAQIQSVERAETARLRGEAVERYVRSRREFAEHEVRVAHELWCAAHTDDMRCAGLWR